MFTLARGQNFIEIFGLMLASLYIFNVRYPKKLEGSLMILQKFLLGTGDETKSPQKVLQLISKVKKSAIWTSSYIIKFIAFSYFLLHVMFCGLLLQTLLKIKSLQCIFGILKSIVCKRNSKHGFYSSLVLIVLRIIHSALKRNIPN